MKRSRSPESAADGDDKSNKRQRTRDTGWWKTHPFATPLKDLRLNEALLDTGILPSCLLSIIHDYSDWTVLSYVTTFTWTGMWHTMASDGKVLNIASRDHQTIVRYDIGTSTPLKPEKCGVPNIWQLHFDASGRLFCLANQQVFELCPRTFAVRDWWCSVDAKDRIVRHDADHGLTIASFADNGGTSFKFCCSPRTECRLTDVTIQEMNGNGTIYHGRMARSIETHLAYCFSRFKTFTFHLCPDATSGAQDASSWTSTTELPQGPLVGFLAPGYTIEFSGRALRLTVLNRGTTLPFAMNLPGTILDIAIENNRIFFLFEDGDSTRLDVYNLA